MSELAKTPLTAADLQQFTGSETFYRHALNHNVVYTEGARCLADRAGAYWLLDAIVSHQHDKKVKGEEFQVWKLQRDTEGNGAVLTCEDGNHHKVTSQRIEFTDFPLSEVELWFTNNTILLPSEY